MAQVTGYYKGVGYTIEVSPILGVYMDARAAWALYYMAVSAARDGVMLVANSGFRTMAEQEKLHRELGATQAVARPGYSNHQMGWAVDLRTKEDSRVLPWLRANASRFSFYGVVASEPWHWEWRPLPASPA